MFRLNHTHRALALILMTIFVLGVFVMLPETTFAQQPADPNKIDLAPEIASCSGMFSSASLKCWTDWLLVNIGTLILSLGVLIVYLGGYLFDSLLQAVVLGFGQTLSQFGLTGTANSPGIIDNAWTFFRDLGNILLIGLFVFIAISLILGLKEYGQKRLIARVLLIAVLMNFSLLFAKIVIDASNFVAYAIYTQTAGAGQAPGTVASISDKFLKPMKIQSVYDTKRVNVEVANQPDKGGFVALLFSFFGFFLLAAIGIVLMYGTFLLAQRAVTLLIIMVAAPLAFASYLMPNMEDSAIGWKNWWKALFNNAVFAPVLVMFLAVSFLIVGEASTKTENVSLGAVIVKPAELRDAWEVLFLYLIGLLLLLGSFVLSSRLAGSISNFKVGKWATGGVLAGGAALLGFAGQQGIGRLAMMRAQSKDRDLAAARRAYHAPGGQTTQNWDRIQKLVNQKSKAEAAAKSSFNLMNTQLGKTLASRAGLGKFGQTSGSFHKTVHKQEEKAIAAAKNVQLTDGDKAKIRKEAENAAVDARRPIAAEKEAVHAAATKGLDEATKSLQTLETAIKSNIEKDGKFGEANTKVESLKQGRTELVAQHERDIAADQKIAESGSGDERAAAVKRIVQKRAEHKTELAQQEQKIKEAQDEVGSIVASYEAPFRKELDILKAEKEKHLTDVRGARTSLNSLHEEAVAEAKVAAKKTIEELDKSFAETRNSQAGRYATWTARGETAQHQIHHGLDEAFKTKTNAQKLTENLQKGLKDLQKSEGGETNST